MKGGGVMIYPHLFKYINVRECELVLNRKKKHTFDNLALHT